MGREEEIAYAIENNIPVEQTKKSPYSYDENMWANTGEGGEIEDPAKIPPLENILKWCNTPQQAPDEVETIRIGFRSRRTGFTERNANSEEGPDYAAERNGRKTRGRIFPPG